MDCKLVVYGNFGSYSTGIAVIYANDLVIGGDGSQQVYVATIEIECLVDEIIKVLGEY